MGSGMPDSSPPSTTEAERDWLIAAATLDGIRPDPQLASDSTGTHIHSMSDEVV
jgi:hypothetical protein